MVVYTPLDNSEMNEFIGKYDIGSLISFQGIREGIENTNYFVNTDQNRFILTIFEKRSVPEQIPFFMDLMDHLSAYGINCPCPVKDKKGNTIRFVHDKPAAITSFLSGRPATTPSFTNCRYLGRTAAKIHEAARNFSGTRENLLAVPKLPPIWDKVKDAVKEMNVAVYDEIAADLDDAIKRWPTFSEDLPAGIVHADLFPDNVFFNDVKVSGVIDFYFACCDILAYELAICLNAWCFERDFDLNVTKVRHLLSGYQSVRPLSKKELDYLPLFCKGSALRFLMTRLYDRINHDENALVTPKDPMEYLRKLRFHRSITNHLEYGV